MIAFGSGNTNWQIEWIHIFKVFCISFRFETNEIILFVHLESRILNLEIDTINKCNQIKKFHAIPTQIQQKIVDIGMEWLMLNVRFETNLVSW